MTQQQVFSLYLASDGQKVETPHGIYPYYAVDTIMDGIECIVSSDAIQQSYFISDCKLILKRIADMSEGDKKECRDLMLVGLMDKHGVIPKGFFDYGEWRYYHTYESILWLIAHGYCLDEQWIENGWVTCQK